MCDTFLIAFSNVPFHSPLARARLERSLHPAMGWRSEERERRVAALRKAARRCGVPRDGPGGWHVVHDRSKKASVEALAQACAASSAPESAKEEAKEAHQAFLATFPTAPADPAPKARALPLSPSRRARSAFALARARAGPKEKAKKAAKAKGKAKAKARAREDGTEEEAPDSEEALAGAAQAGVPEGQGEGAAEGAGNEEGEAEGGGRAEQTRTRVRGRSFLPRTPGWEREKPFRARVRNAAAWVNAGRGAALKRMISSMPRRIKACVEAKGALTPY